MKKLISLLLIACMAFGVLGVASVSAADNNEVLMGTPTIDGKVDDIYKQSLTIVYDGKNNAVAHEWKDATLTAYALYDADYVYAVAEVVDDDVVGADENWVKTDGNPYMNDVVEFRFNYVGANAVQFKVGVDAKGVRAYTQQGTVVDINAVKYATTETDNGYIVEIAVPTTLLTKDSVLNTAKLGMKLWLFDLQADAAGKAAPAYGTECIHYSELIGDEGAQGNPVLYALSTKKAEAKPADTQKPTETPKPATTGEVLMGTPTIDAKIDDIYKSSLTIVYDGTKNAVAHEWKDATATTYVLYDADYVYLTTKVVDDDVVSADENWIKTDANPYLNDVVEYRFNYKGASDAVQFKVGVDAKGLRAYTTQGTVLDITTVKYAAALTDDGYIVEVAVPTSVLTKDSVINVGKLGLKVWLFDLQADAAGKVNPGYGTDCIHYSEMIGDVAQGNPVLYNLSTEKAVAPTTPSTGTTTPDAPSTFDAAIVVAVAAMISGTAVVIGKKRR